jgi:hypothetical protein
VSTLMGKPHLDNVRVVLVTTDNCDHQIWMTAAAREKAAVDRILDAIPEGWTASLLDIKLSTRERSELNLQAGEVRRLT